MRLPSKITSYSESVISKFPPVLTALHNDLAVLNLTKLPILVHDSVVLKQISDDAIEKIIELYSTCGKQIIIALDKQDSYSEKTSHLLSDSAVLRLTSNGKELFGRSWG